jgi:hypothetical protein
MAWPSRRLSPRAAALRFQIAPWCVAAGIVLNRLNISWFGLVPAAGVFYVPQLWETVLVVAMAMAGVLAFIAIANILPVFPARPGAESSPPQAG